MIIKIDTKEKLPLPFKASPPITAVVVDGLPFADYWGEWEPGSEKAGYSCEMPVCFERKSIQDLFGTLTAGYERFKREVEKARKNNFKIVLIVEGSLSEVLAGTKYSKVEGKSILKTMFTLWAKYDVFPVFTNNRGEMTRFITETFDAIGRNYEPKGLTERVADGETKSTERSPAVDEGSDE